jgi:hypothetical protein
MAVRHSERGERFIGLRHKRLLLLRHRTSGGEDGDLHRTPAPAVGRTVKDELADLAHAFNHTAARLRTSRDEISRANEELEKRQLALQVAMEAAPRWERRST